MNWIAEKYSTEVVEYEDDKSFTIIKVVSEVTEQSLEKGEEYFLIPSKFVRDELNIKSTDKNFFLNASEEILALFHELGKPYHDSQKYLFVDHSKFYSAIESKHLVPFWIAFQYQETTLEHKKKEQSHHNQNCRLWLVWEEKGKLKEFLYHDGYFKSE